MDFVLLALAVQRIHSDGIVYAHVEFLAQQKVCEVLVFRTCDIS